MSTNRLFDALAARPDDAVVLRSATSVWTAKAVRDEVERLTARLAGARVVALLADNSPEWALTDLAALHAGVVLLPLPGFFTPAQLQHALNQSGPHLVATDQPARTAPPAKQACTSSGIRPVARHMAESAAP